MYTPAEEEHCVLGGYKEVFASGSKNLHPGGYKCSSRLCLGAYSNLCNCVHRAGVIPVICCPRGELKSAPPQGGGGGVLIYWNSPLSYCEAYTFRDKDNFCVYVYQTPSNVSFSA